jgi:uncharacterized protein YkwD
MVGSDRYGFYAGLIPPQTNTSAGSKPPQRLPRRKAGSWVLNPRANKVRTDPKKYAELYIQPRLRYYSGKNYSVPGQITILTQEGASAVNSCVTALGRASIVGILIPEEGLSLAAKDHAADQSRTGQTGHNGNDRSTPETRMKRYGAFSGSWTLGENIAYGGRTGRDIVCDLLIDDGIPEVIG